ncbi:hypothetical protein D0867_05222 [Hortaea werneckii]|uniref:Uncharacterized protein n=1 Tax=Hortaea werneckii TaxID=91943 RepID=A0A3M6ZTL2_HORWE|nr:hypothetical protein D0867_05222 [Hortaea werneckii]
MVSLLDHSNTKHPRKTLWSLNARHGGLILPERLLYANARELRSRAHATSGQSGRGGIQYSARNTPLNQDIQEDAFDVTHILASLQWPSTLLRTSRPSGTSAGLNIVEQLSVDRDGAAEARHAATHRLIILGGSSDGEVPETQNIQQVSAM